jgi:hypothetical protein
MMRRSLEPEVGLSVAARRSRAAVSWAGSVVVFMGPVYATACGDLVTTPNLLRFPGMPLEKMKARRLRYRRAFVFVVRLGLAAFRVEAVDAARFGDGRQERPFERFVEESRADLVWVVSVGVGDGLRRL